MHGEEVINELGEEISKGKGCIVFDFACYFPYADQDFLIFKFKLGEEELEPYKYNHRYPNKDYVTISKKMGRRVSRIGYPVFVDLNEEYFFILEIEVGIKDYKTVKLDFPVIVKLTEENLYAILDFVSISMQQHFNLKAIMSMKMMVSLDIDIQFGPIRIIILKMQSS